MTDTQQAQEQEFDQEVTEATPPPEETIEDRRARAREMVPVTPGQGITPENYQGFVTVAQGMSKAYLMLPPHLHDNVAVMIGVMDIAARARLSPYMLGMQTYVQNGRLCFMSMAFHALARPFLNGGLKGEYIDEGDEMQLVVRGRLKGDPAIYEHRSPRLKQLHPGHTEKDGKKFVKGSPLWDRKPQQQMWYDTTRDWVRKFCPQAVLGVYTPEEVAEAEDMKDVTPPLRERLAPADRPATGEGFRDGAHVEGEMARARAPVKVAAEPEPETEPPSRPSAPRRMPPADRPEPAGKPAAKPRPGQRPTGKTPPQPSAAREKARLRKPPPPTRAQVKRAADRAESSPRPSKPAPASAPTRPDRPAPRTERWRTYVAETLAWIENATDAVTAEERWLAEKDMRDDAGVPIVERHRLKARLDDVCAALGKKE